jgi:hypothetical protein
MRRKGYLFTAVVSVLLLAAGFANAQQTPAVAEPSFDVSLHLVLGSHEGGRGDLPSDLAAVTKQMRSTFAFSNYRLASTFFGRISNSGSFDYKSVSNMLGQPSTADMQTFLEWSLGDFQTVPLAGGGQGVRARAFRFGAKVPVVMGVTGGDKAAASIQYESIGVNVGRFVIAQNTPTLIGTLNLPGTSGTIFLVMTVRSAY